ncbi:hypothetical protein [Alkalicoccus urumqiensis]|uniref:Uncharacterized protein n=1 Tax=Alkalicoccus urumqiensis TaxID=1548213 RepID=A0A2P6MF18_ALKUR|nr:hypothetical protein [Alkalicoccus urumqiensis]PRO64864.1 hypothetical protein C6I21_12000 [Alkalicoccus urumqiensis]
MRRWISVLLLLAACGTETSSENTIPLKEKVEKTPLHLEYAGSRTGGSQIQMHFLVSHTDETLIHPEDYVYQWPEYIQDSEGIAYRIADADYSYDMLGDTALEPWEAGVTLTIKPPPEKVEDVVFTIPFHTVPKRYEEGYLFRVERDNPSIQNGDMAVQNLDIEEQSLSFRLDDAHPDADSRTGYMVTLLKDGERVFPVSRRVNRSSRSTSFELMFAEPFNEQETLLIDRMSGDLPEWRFSLTVSPDSGG